MLFLSMSMNYTKNTSIQTISKINITTILTLKHKIDFVCSYVTERSTLINTSLPLHLLNKTEPMVHSVFHLRGRFLVRKFYLSQP